MRNLFLVLVLANLGFAAWHTWFAHHAVPVHPAPSGLPSITLVSELPPDLKAADSAPKMPGDSEVGAAPEATARALSASEDDEPALSAVPAAGAVAAEFPAGAAQCTSVGPFRELGQAASAAANLRAAGYDPMQRVAEGDIWIGYWVYVEAIRTEAEANAILEKVRAAGMVDSYLIPNSDSGNLVSLGVFGEISGVSQRRDQARALGLEPKVVDRTRRGTVYWVDVDVAPGQALDMEALHPPGRILRLEQRRCR
jgi:cell division septation protein DedD